MKGERGSEGGREGSKQGERDRGREGKGGKEGGRQSNVYRNGQLLPMEVGKQSRTYTVALKRHNAQPCNSALKPPFVI